MFNPGVGAGPYGLRMTTSTPSTTSQTADQLRRVLDDLAAVVAAVQPSQLHAPTPCRDFDVEQLRTHIVGWLTTFTEGYADPGGQAPRASLDGYEPPKDPVGAVRDATATLDRALRDGAAERPLRLGEAEMPGDVALGMILGEYVVHGWDLARATGQPWAPPAAAVERALADLSGMLTPDFQGEGKSFGLSVPVTDDASPLERLLGLSGRDPHWSPA